MLEVEKSSWANDENGEIREEATRQESYDNKNGVDDKRARYGTLGHDEKVLRTRRINIICTARQE